MYLCISGNNRSWCWCSLKLQSFAKSFISMYVESHQFDYLQFSIKLIKRKNSYEHMSYLVFLARHYFDNSSCSVFSLKLYFRSIC